MLWQEIYYFRQLSQLSIWIFCQHFSCFSGVFSVTEKMMKLSFSSDGAFDVNIKVIRVIEYYWEAFFWYFSTFCFINLQSTEKMLNMSKIYVDSSDVQNYLFDHSKSENPAIIHQTYLYDNYHVSQRRRRQHQLLKVKWMGKKMLNENGQSQLFYCCVLSSKQLFMTVLETKWIFHWKNDSNSSPIQLSFFHTSAGNVSEMMWLIERGVESCKWKWSRNLNTRRRSQQLSRIWRMTIILSTSYVIWLQP